MTVASPLITADGTTLSGDAPTLTKIVATVGPASSRPETIAKLIDAGVSIFRFNFSHGVLEQHAENLRVIREIAAERGRSPAVLGDLQGPKLRVGPVPGETVTVEAGATVRFVRDPAAVAASPLAVTCTYDGLVDDAEPGHRLLVADGAVRMLVVEKRPGTLVCTVTHGGDVQTGKGVNVPDTQLRVRLLAERDWAHVRWAVESGLDFLALSFVRRADDLAELADGIARITAERSAGGGRLPIIAKIEVPEALEHIDAIVRAADGIMIARGDLGVEIDLALVPVVQKRLVEIAQSNGKPCIVATQMFESMISSPTPTRAEANDVAGAIFDRADAVMLSGETAVGRFPVLAVEHMDRIARHTEHHLATLPSRSTSPGALREARVPVAALAHGVWTVAQDIDARCIVTWSESGTTARLLSRQSFDVPILAVTSDAAAARRMQILRGVEPRRMDVPDDLDEFARETGRWLRDTGRAAPGDAWILVAGQPLGRPGVTNHVAIHSAP
jgi:pyruvate kinase